MTTNNLTDNDFGQWISICVGIGAVFSLFWTIIGEKGKFEDDTIPLEDVKINVFELVFQIGVGEGFNKDRRRTM